LDSAYHLISGKTVLFGMADTIMQPQNVFRYILDCSSPEDDVILGLFSVKRPEKFGMVDLDSTGRVHRIIDKPISTNLKYAWGCIIWRPRFSQHLHTSVNDANISDFAKIMNLAIEQGMKFRGVVVEGGDYSDLGTYEEIYDLETRYRD
jgi:glucose-1-phosphate thymidylyltransferase